MELDDGTVLVADLVVAAVGSVPATGWLRGSGLPLDGGVRCDVHCRAAEGVYVAGDVACWHNPVTGRRHRFEHRTNAAEQGRHAALNLLGASEPFTPSRFLWTDQGDVRLQAVGEFGPEATFEIVDGSVGDRKFVATCPVAGVVTGVVGWRDPRRFTRLRARLGLAATARL